MSLNSLTEILMQCEKEGIELYEYVIRNQMIELEVSRVEIISGMQKNLDVMREAVKIGKNEEQKSLSGLTRGAAFKYAKHMKEKTLPGGELFNSVVANALAVSEVNACMGRIVAAPTAGSCGIIPAVIFPLADEYKKDDPELINALLCASCIGAVIAKRATLSGAEGGCQAECGSASAMAAAAGATLIGGTAKMCVEAAALALKNTLGLVCDPVAGLVEVPCVKRNVMGAVNALSSMNLALAGIESVIPADEVIDAMGDIGAQIHTSLRETSEGGLAVTPMGRKLAQEILGKEATEK